jgi:hypothetical protein
MLTVMMLFYFMTWAVWGEELTEQGQGCTVSRNRAVGLPAHAQGGPGRPQARVSHQEVGWLCRRTFVLLQLVLKIAPLHNWSGRQRDRQWPNRTEGSFRTLSQDLPSSLPMLLLQPHSNLEVKGS